MSTLSQLQQRFSRALLDRDGSKASNEFISLINETEELSRLERIGIYRSNFSYSLSQVLKDAYPVCLKLVGEKYFEQLCSQYVSLHPSQDHDLNRYGAYFSDYLEKIVQERPEAKSLAYLPDVARLEWSKLLSYYSLEDEPFDFDAFSKVPAEHQSKIVFKLTASGYLLSSDYPVYSIWAANVDEREGDSFGDNSPERVFIWRENYVPQVSVIDNSTYLILSALNKGATFGELLWEIKAKQLQVDIDLLLPKLIEKRWITGFCKEIGS